MVGKVPSILVEKDRVSVSPGEWRSRGDVASPLSLEPILLRQQADRVLELVGDPNQRAYPA
jgi:hypothetical protein